MKNKIQIPPEKIREFEDIAIKRSKETYQRDYIAGYIDALKDAYIQNNGIDVIPYPVSLSTSDTICWYVNMNDIHVLLGRKQNEAKWQFPGGFRNPKETSLMAAKRELEEETSIDIEEDEFNLIDEFFIDDMRYENSPHKITTTLYYVRLNFNHINMIKAKDDLAEVKLFHVTEVENLLIDIHKPLFEAFLNRE